MTARAAFAVAGLAVLAAGCSGGAPSTSATPTPTPTFAVSPDPSLAAQLSPAVRAAGVITVAVDATYQPDEFIGSDNRTVVGWDVELITAVAQVMGVTARVVDDTFDRIIADVQAGRYDVGMSSIPDTKAREQQVDLVTYFVAGSAFFVKTTGGPDIQSLADLCGHRVSVETGTTEAADAQAQAMACTAAGKPPVTVDVYADQSSANAGLSSGHDDVEMADSPIAAYQVHLSHGAFRLSGKPYGSVPYGIATGRGNGLAPLLLAALKDLMSHGTYGDILRRWGEESGALTTPVVDGAAA